MKSPVAWSQVLTVHNTLNGTMSLWAWCRLCLVVTFGEVLHKVAQICIALETVLQKLHLLITLQFQGPLSRVVFRLNKFQSTIIIHQLPLRFKELAEHLSASQCIPVHTHPSICLQLSGSELDNCQQMAAYELMTLSVLSTCSMDPETGVIYTGGHFNQVVFAVHDFSACMG